jgi:hypothetical protein
MKPATATHGSADGFNIYVGAMVSPIDRMRDWLLAHPTGRWVVLGSCVGVLCGLTATVFEIGVDLPSKYLLVDLAQVPPQVASTHSTASSSEHGHQRHVDGPLPPTGANRSKKRKPNAEPKALPPTPITSRAIISDLDRE